MTDITVPPFYLNGFVANPVDSDSVITEFAAGQDFRLSWASNGTAFTVYAARDPNPVYSGTERVCTIRGGRSRTTTFILAASVTGGPGSGTPNPGFETIYLYETLTVTISNPDETPRSVTAGALTVTGGSDLKGDTGMASAKVGGSLTVSGATQLDGGATASGLTVNGTTTLQGATTLTNATVNGLLTVTGATTLSGATIASLTVNGSVAMMAPRKVDPNRGYTASSDGLMVATVWWPGDAGKKCAATVGGWSAATGWLFATGGNAVIHQTSGGWTQWGIGNTVTMPVAKGAAFQTHLQQVDGRELDAPTSFWWVPFGRNAGLTELSESEVSALGAEPPPASPSETPAYDPTTAIAELVAVARELAGGDMDDAAQQELTDALRSLVLHQP
jgi:hypothetical protein